ncbi:MAG: hypothetical protein RIT14_2041, partial [Pseudomonadota bacterium]
MRRALVLASARGLFLGLSLMLAGPSLAQTAEPPAVSP